MRMGRFWAGVFVLGAVLLGAVEMESRSAWAQSVFSGVSSGGEGDVVVLDFASLPEETGEQGYSRAIGEQFRLFVRDKDATWWRGYELPKEISQKSHWEVTLLVSRFEGGYLSVGVGDSKRHGGLYVPLNGGKCLVGYYYPYNDLEDRKAFDHRNFYETSQEIRTVSLPAKVQFVYNGLEQLATVLVNDQEVASYKFATFKNRIPWNITHIFPLVHAGKAPPTLVDFDGKVSLRAW